MTHIILKEILSVSKSLFHRFSPATLLKQDMQFFDEQSETITKACLPEKPSNFQKKREEALEKADEIEENNHTIDYKPETELFWNLNFYTVQGFIHIIIHSIGSDKLNGIIGSVCDKKGTPISQVIKHGVNMWYCKGLPIEKNI